VRDLTGNFKISFLGGLGEIGKNCAVIEHKNKLLIVDCGVMFPTEEMPGVDLVIPDFSSILESKSSVAGVVITHGHEDHIGALSYLLESIPLDIYGSKLSLKIAGFRINEAGLKNKANLIEVSDMERRSIGPFDVEFVPVTHSVPHSFAIVLHTAIGAIIHTGDFKLDYFPLDNRRTNLSRFGEISQTEKVRLLLVDSTNADKTGITESESTVGPELDKIFAKESQNRVIAACFSSHLHRVEQIINTAYLYGRKTKILGKSMSRNIKAASDLKVISIPTDSLLVADKKIDQIEDGKLCIVCTGSQGEPLAALSQLAYGQYRSVSIKKNDAIILSSHPIPGNERSVSKVINLLEQRGAKVYHSLTTNVHVSGHARSSEIASLISIIKPEAYIPVHGEFRHLNANSKIAKNMGVKDVLMCLDGDVVEISDKDIKIIDKVEAQYVFVDGSLDDVDSNLLKERTSLSQNGIVIVIVTVDSVTKKKLYPVKVVSKGWVDPFGNEDLTLQIEKLVEDYLIDLSKKQLLKEDQISKEIRELIIRFIKSKTKRKPIVIPVLIGV
jgi:ribonuclease J